MCAFVDVKISSKRIFKVAAPLALFPNELSQTGFQRA